MNENPWKNLRVYNTVELVHNKQTKQLIMAISKYTNIDQLKASKQVKGIFL